MQAVLMVGGGQYITCLAEGYFRLGSKPTGVLLVDAIQSTAVYGTYGSSAGIIVYQMAIAAGVAAAKVDAVSFNNAAVNTSSIVGIYVKDNDTTFAKAMDAISASVGMFYVFNPAGVLFAGFLTAPAGLPDFSLATFDIQDNIERSPAKDNGLPIYQVRFGYRKNYNTQSSVAASVSTTTANALAQDYLYIYRQDVTVKTQFLLADIMTVESLIRDASQAAAQADRLLALYKVRRDIFTLTVAMDSLPAAPPQLASQVMLTYNRMGLGAGRLFKLLGIGYDFVARTATLTLWG